MVLTDSKLCPREARGAETNKQCSAMLDVARQLIFDLQTPRFKKLIFIPTLGTTVKLILS